MSSTAPATERSSGRTVLVTGAAGFLGSQLVELLSAAGRHRVLATDTSHSARSERLAGLPGVQFQDVDLREAQALEAMVEGCTDIVHLAALRPAATRARPREAFEVNVAATHDLIALAAKHGVRRIVYGSSHSVYGSFAHGRDFRFRETETADPRGLNMYGASKLAVEAYLSAFAAAGGPQYLSLRIGTVYGPQANRDNSLGGMMIDAIDAVRRGERPVVRWAPDSLNDLVYVTDGARALAAALDLDPAVAVNTAINVVGEPVSSELVFSTLVELAGGDPASIDWRPDQTRYQLVSQDKMLATLGPLLSTTLTDGLRSFLEWARADELEASSVGHTDSNS